jgi:DNA-binding MarR family transcriptional regulator
MPPSEFRPGAPGLHAALVRHTGYLLSRLGMWGAKRFSERLETIGLTPRMWGALNVLSAESPISQQQLGRAIGMDPSSMVSTIDELERRGLVQRRPHPSDRRAYALHITDQGREVLTRGRRLSMQAQAELLAPLNEAERDQLHDMLLRLAVAAGTVSDEDPFKTGPGSA